jgi:hypothetical protein
MTRVRLTVPKRAIGTLAVAAGGFATGGLCMSLGFALVNDQPAARAVPGGFADDALVADAQPVSDASPTVTPSGAVQAAASSKSAAKTSASRSTRSRAAAPSTRAVTQRRRVVAPPVTSSGS